jgi:hypothetical protein
MSLENTLAQELDQQLNPAFKPHPIKDVLKNVPRQEVITKTAVMTRMADAMHRMERVAEQMEKAADEAERQLEIVKRRL